MTPHYQTGNSSTYIKYCLLFIVIRCILDLTNFWDKCDFKETILFYPIFYSVTVFTVTELTEMGSQMWLKEQIQRTRQKNKDAHIFVWGFLSAYGFLMFCLYGVQAGMRAGWVMTTPNFKVRFSFLSFIRDSTFCLVVV